MPDICLVQWLFTGTVYYSFGSEHSKQTTDCCYISTGLSYTHVKIKAFMVPLI